MSTITYAQLTNKRDQADPGTSTAGGSPGMKTYVDALAALVPAEVLTLHALIISATTSTTPVEDVRQGLTTTISPDAVGTLSGAFWALVVCAVVLYVVPRYFGGRWDRWDWLRCMISPVAFVAWTMLQRATAFDAAFPRLDGTTRTVVALFIAAILAAISAGLASLADRKTPT